MLRGVNRGPHRRIKMDILRRRIENGIEQRFGFRSDVILRTSSEMRDAISRSPFAARHRSQ